MTLQKILILFFPFLLLSCGDFFYKNEQSDFEASYKLKSPTSSCSLQESPSKLEIAGTNKDAVLIFENLIKTNSSFKTLSLLELNITWALFQLNLRPDIVSPTSRLQVMLKLGRDLNYYQFDKRHGETPYLTGLEYLLKKHGSRYKLDSLARLLYKNLPRSIPISKGMANFLADYSQNLKKHNSFKVAYFKASQVIRKGESLPKAKFVNLVKTSNSLKSKPITHLFQYQSSPHSTTKCNIDLNLYKNNVYLISPRENPEGIPFGISNKYGRYLLMVASNYFNEVSPYKNFFQIQGNTEGNPLVFCHIKNDVTKNEYTLLSSKGRDPGQHIFHLIRFEIQNSTTPLETQEYINFPRHLFLRNPDRLVYESRKGSEKQLRNFLSLDFPIYHKGHLGRVWVHSHHKDIKRSSLLLDHRTESTLACIK